LRFWGSAVLRFGLSGCRPPVLGSEGSGRPAEPRTSEPQNLRTSEPQNLRTSEPQNLRTSEPQNLRTSEPQNLRTSEPQNPRTPEPQNRNPPPQEPGVMSPSQNCEVELTIVRGSPGRASARQLPTSETSR